MLAARHPNLTASLILEDPAWGTAWGDWDAAKAGIAQWFQSIKAMTNPEERKFRRSRNLSDSYRFNIGDFQCLAVNDGYFVGNADMLFANAPQEELLQALQLYGLKPDHLPSTWTCLLVKTPTNVVLVDSGIGVGGQYCPPETSATCQATQGG